MHTNGSAYRTHPGANRKITLLAAALLSSLLLVQAPAPLMAQSTQQQTLQLEIAAGPLDPALSRLGTEANLTLLYSPALVAGKTTRGLSGRHTPAEALRLLLAGTGLPWDARGDTTFVLRNATTAEQTPVAAPAEQAPRRQAQPAQEKVTDLQSMTVTGTRIRGGVTPSPVISIGTENLREEGFTDLGEVIRSVPQNFTGGQNPGVLMGNVTGGGLANQNQTGASGLNLRGLGPDASLTLVNGRRMSYGGFVQAVDISAIPVEAVERIEIVADGASAIYGSDAVGGVGNVVLKRDFEGVTLGTRYGTTSDGGLTTREHTATAGTTWATGGLIATYKKASIDPIYAWQRDYTDHLREPAAIYPGSDLRSIFLSAHQSVGDFIYLRLDALRNRRDQLYYYSYNSTTVYNKLTPETKLDFLSPSIEFMLPNDWTLSLGGAWGKDEYREYTERFNVTTNLLSQLQRRCFCNKSRMYDIGAEGPLFSMNGGDARLAMGAGYRRNEFLQYDMITGATIIQGSEGSRFAYTELNLPLMGAQSGGLGTEQLVATAALRSEDYDSFGRVTTPKIGVIWRPSADFTLKSSWGKSFKAPTLHQRFSVSFAQVGLPGSFGGIGHAPDQTAVAIGGGNPDLDPERAETWSASLMIHPEFLPGLEAELTSFYIDYSDRAIQPITNASAALRDPIYSEFVVFSPTPDLVTREVAGTEVFLETTGGLYDPTKVFAIFYTRFVNATRQRIKGVDLSGSYRFDLAGGQMTVRGSTSWLDSTQQTLGTPTSYDLAGTLHNPAKINSRLGSVWSQGKFTTSAFANYVGGVRDRSNGVKGASMTTFDATLRYDTGERSDAWSGLQFVLAANNLFNRNPPLYFPNAAAYVAPYDSTNYSAIGRFLSLSVSKHW